MKKELSKYYVCGNKIKKKPFKFYNALFYIIWAALMAAVILT
jgi:hypothetical protein